jgi:C-terminal processing protease CtpA/Prc
MGFALLALIALCPLSRASEAEATGQGTPIGVTVARISDELREQPGYRTGVLVTRVAPGSLAHQAGIVKGDVLVVLGSVTLRKVDDLARAESLIEAGHPISIVVSREEGRLVRMMKLEPPGAPAAEEDESAAGSADAARSVAARSVEERGAARAAGMAEPAVLPRVEAAAPATPGLSRIGVRCENLNADLAAALGMPGGRGVLVLQVADRGPAALAGVRAGDVILRVGDQRIWGAEHLGTVVESLEMPLSMTVRRRGTERKVELRPEEAGLLETGQPAGSEGEALKSLRDEVQMLRREVQKLRDRIAGMTDEVY